MLLVPGRLALRGDPTLTPVIRIEKGNGFQVYSHALVTGTLILCRQFMGPDNFSTDAKWAAKHTK